jgi:hypothetical protein
MSILTMDTRPLTTHDCTTLFFLRLCRTRMGILDEMFRQPVVRAALGALPPWGGRRAVESEGA